MVAGASRHDIVRGAVMVLMAIDHVDEDEWNEYQIRCEGKRVQTWINGVPMIDYTEPDDSIEQFGQIGLQVHGGGVTEIYYKDITIEVLP